MIFLGVAFGVAQSNTMWMNWMMVGMLPATIFLLLFFKVEYKRLELDSDGVLVSKFDTFGIY